MKLIIKKRLITVNSFILIAKSLAISINKVYSLVSSSPIPIASSSITPPLIVPASLIYKSYFETAV